MAELHLEIAHKTVELVRAVSNGRSEPAEPPSAPLPHEPTEAGHPTALAVSAAPAPASTHFTFEPSAGAHALLRLDAADLLLGVGLRVGLTPRLGLHAWTALSPSSGPGIEVLEWQAQLGLGYRRAVTHRLQGELAALGGLVVHHFSMEDAMA